MTGNTKQRLPAPGPQSKVRDLTVSAPVNASSKRFDSFANDRLIFDGYELQWKSELSAEYAAFSGQADGSARESEKNIGPTPQGLFAVDPNNIEELEPSEDWGKYRVRIEPYRSTVDRMKDCFKVIRTGMYIHGGKLKGTSGCIEINDDNEESDFFSRLKKYGRKIELEVKFSGERKTELEEPSCPY